jgi:hypothetical protein
MAVTPKVKSLEVDLGHCRSELRAAQEEALNLRHTNAELRVAHRRYASAAATNAAAVHGLHRAAAAAAARVGACVTARLGFLPWALEGDARTRSNAGFKKKKRKKRVHSRICPFCALGAVDVALRGISVCQKKKPVI